MNSRSIWQLVHLAAMTAAVAGIIYALEYLRGGKALWFWVALLGAGFVGLLFAFRAAQRQDRGRSGKDRSGRLPRRR